MIEVVVWLVVWFVFWWSIDHINHCGNQSEFGRVRSQLDLEWLNVGDLDE